MTKLIYLTMTSIGAALGWWAGAFVGIGTAMALSTVGSCVGVYAAWRLIRDVLD